MMKTLIGKNGYLFLQNDSNRELEIHNDNLLLVTTDFSIRPNGYFENYLLSIFPDKSLVCKEYLPDGYDMKYRPGYDAYKKYWGEKAFDLLPYLIKEDTYYKTDTHINLNGSYIIYQVVVDKINELYNLGLEKHKINIEQKKCVLADLNLGIGDLTWPMNLGDQQLNDVLDNFYYSNDLHSIYCSYKIDKNNPIHNLKILNFDLEDETVLNDDVLIDWTIVSNYILYTKNDQVVKKHRVIVFYDSMLLSTLDLWMRTFNEVYFIKSTSTIYYNTGIIERINPDYIFEFTIERFLC